MKTTTHSPKTARSRSRELWARACDDLRQRRQESAEYRVLERELASYNTRADMDDLLGSVGRAEGANAERIRMVLARNHRRNWLAS